MKKTILFILIFAVSLALAAQSSKSNVKTQSNEQSNDQSEMAMPNSGPAVAQDHVAREVLHQLLMLPYYSVFDDLRFQVGPNHDVTLMGAVTRPSIKSDAESAVKSVQGVESVTNNIEVLPLSPMDQRIRIAEYRAIYSYDGLTKYAWPAVPSIHIIVKNGHVRLEGVVDNSGDKTMAGIQAKSVPGVFSVENNLRVVNPKDQK